MKSTELKYEMADMSQNPKCAVTIIIVNWNTRLLTLDLLASLDRNRPEASHEAIVVDNASTDGSREAIAERFPWVHLFTTESNLGFAGGVNLALPQSQGQYILLLNTDMLVFPGAIDAQVAFIKSTPGCGICGGRLQDPLEAPGLSYGHFPGVRSLLTEIFFHRFGWNSRLACIPVPDLDQPFEVDFVSGANLMIRREVVEQIGLLDERFFLYFEETDWCFRARKAGWQVYYVPAVRYLHFGSASSSSELLRQQQFNQSLDLFVHKHYRGAHFAICWLLVQLLHLQRGRRARKKERLF